MIEKTLKMFEKSDGSLDDMITFFDKTNTPNEKVTFGYALFPPGKRVPEEGVSCHEHDEYSFIIKGTAKLVIDGKTTVSGPNSAGFIPAGEEHYSYNDSDETCELIWMLVEK